MRDVGGIEVTDGDVRGSGMKKELVLRQMEIPLMRIDYPPSARFQSRFELI
jgi:hypothetical protein